MNGLSRLSNRVNLLLVFLNTLLIFFLACDESLPPRNDPSILFDGIINSKYTLLWNQNSLQIEVGLINIYDETIQANANIAGTVEVILLRNNSLKKTIHFDVSNLSTPKFYNPTTQEITINPGDTIKFLYVWNFIGDNNTNFPEDVFHSYEDLTCPGRFLAHSESFILTGSFQILEKLNSVRLKPAVLNLCYVYRYVPPRDCPAPPTACTPL
jgi:hypothetical protein